MFVVFAGHAELTALIGQISLDGGFPADCDLLTLSTLEENLHAFCAGTWLSAFGTVFHNGGISFQ